jgi:transcription termination factor NusB
MKMLEDNYLEAIELIPNGFNKYAQSVIELGDPQAAGKSLAEIVKFITKRISKERRTESLGKLRNKIWNLNEHDISSKKTPPTASLGQAITFLKTVLNGHKPQYIRDILRAVVREL